MFNYLKKKSLKEVIKTTELVVVFAQYPTITFPEHQYDGLLMNESAHGGSEKQEGGLKPVSRVTLWWFDGGVEGVFGGGCSLSTEPGRGWWPQRGPVTVFAH